MQPGFLEVSEHTLTLLRLHPQGGGGFRFPSRFRFVGIDGGLIGADALQPLFPIPRQVTAGLLHTLQSVRSALPLGTEAG